MQVLPLLRDAQHLLGMCEIRTMTLMSLATAAAAALSWLGRPKQAVATFVLSTLLSSWLARGPRIAIAPRGNGRVAIVTGASGALGKKTAQQLVRLGWRVVFAARSEPLLREAVAGLDGATVAVLDLADRRSIEQVVHALPFDAVDLLVCNAGLWRSPDMPEKLASGFTTELGVNHLGHAYLIHLLLPRLRRASESGSGARVVLVSSWGAYLGAFWTTAAGWTRAFNGGYRFMDWFSLAKRFKLYVNSKAANLVYAVALQKKYGAAGKLSFVSVHPGTVATHILLGSLSQSFLSLLSRIVFKAEDEGGSCIVWAATTVAVSGGEFCADGSVWPPPSGATVASARALLQATEAALNFH